MMLLRYEVGQQGVPKGIRAVFISNCAIRSVLFYVLRFMERGTEGNCDRLTQLIGLFGAGVVAWCARDVLGWAMCYGRLSFHKHEEIYLKGGYNGFENENGCVFY